MFEGGIGAYLWDLRLEKIRQLDVNGHLQAAGIKWRQERGNMIHLFCIVMVVAVIAFIIGVLLTLDATSGPPTAPQRALKLLSYWLIGGSVVVAVLVIAIYKSGLVYKNPEITFGRDGTIWTPHGFPGFPFRKKIEGSSSYIGSIEPGRGNGEHARYHVALYSTEGKTVWLADDLYESQAREISVQLNSALDLIRRTI